MNSISPFANLKTLNKGLINSVISINNCESAPGDDFDKMLFARRIEDCQYQLYKLLREFDCAHRMLDGSDVTLIIIPTRQHESILMVRNRCQVIAPIHVVVDESFATRQSSQNSEDFGHNDEPRPFVYREHNETLMTFEVMLSRITEVIGGEYYIFIIPELRKEKLYTSCNGQEIYLGDDQEALKGLVVYALQKREEMSKSQPRSDEKKRGKLAKLVERFFKKS